MKSFKFKTVFLVALLGVSFVYGVLSSNYNWFPLNVARSFFKSDKKELTDAEKELGFRNIGEGFWHMARQVGEEIDEKDRAAGLEKLASLPYLSGVNKAPDSQNVTIFDETLAYDGLNFFVSGHGPEAMLMDMEGRILHKWRFSFQDAWPDPLPFEESYLHKTFWRRARLFPNGDVLAVFEGIGIIRVDRESNLLWELSNRSHHDIFVKEDTVFTLTRNWREKHDKLKLSGKIREDFVSILTADGREIESISILDCFLNSEYMPMLSKMNAVGDIFHTNTLQILDGRHQEKYPMFKKGNALVSLPTQNIIACLDLKQKSVAWAMTGMWVFQHQPTVLDNGNILLFDNMGTSGKSKAVEINPLTRQVVWAYRNTDAAPLFSRTCGSVQRLKNGNTIIVESNAGRALEVRSDREIVWEFMNPFRAGEKNEMIANLFDMIRYERKMFAGQNWFVEK